LTQFGDPTQFSNRFWFKKKEDALLQKLLTKEKNQAIFFRYFDQQIEKNPSICLDSLMFGGKPVAEYLLRKGPQAWACLAQETSWIPERSFFECAVLSDSADLVRTLLPGIEVQKEGTQGDSWARARTGREIMISEEKLAMSFYFAKAQKNGEIMGMLLTVEAIHNHDIVKYQLLDFLQEDKEPHTIFSQLSEEQAKKVLCTVIDPQIRAKTCKNLITEKKNKLMALMVRFGMYADLNKEEKVAVLNAALKAGSLEIAKQMLQSIPEKDRNEVLNTREEEGELPLEVIIRANSKEGVEWLLEAGARVDDPDFDGFKRAINNKNMDIFQLLFSKTPKNMWKEMINGKEEGLYSLFELAVYRNFVPAVEFCMANGATLHLEREKGLEIFTGALRNKNITLFEALLKLIPADKKETILREKGGKIAVRASQQGPEGLVLLEKAGFKSADLSEIQRGIIAGEGSRCKSLPMILFALEKGLPDKGSYSAVLESAVNSKFVEGLDLLLRKGVRVDFATIEGARLLNSAFRRYNIQIGKLLVESIPIDQRKEILNKRQAQLDTPLEAALEANFQYGVEYLLEQGASVEGEDFVGFEHAMSNKSMPILRLLFNKVHENKRREVFLRKAELSGCTLLETAIQLNFVEGVEFCFAHGALWDVESSHDLSSICKKIIQSNNITILQVFFKVLSQEKREALFKEEGAKLLASAVESNCLEVAFFFMQKGLSLQVLKFKKRQKLLQQACSARSLEIVTKCFEGLTKEQCFQLTDARASDMRGSSALHKAAEAGFVEGMPILKEMSRQIDPKNGEEMTPLHLALRKGHVETAVKLLECGANEAAKDRVGKIPVEYLPAQKKGSFEKLYAEKKLSILLQSGKGEAFLEEVRKEIPHFTTMAAFIGSIETMQVEDPAKMVSFAARLNYKPLSDAVLKKIGPNCMWAALHKLERTLSAVTLDAFYKEMFPFTLNEEHFAHFKDITVSPERLESAKKRKVGELHALHEKIREYASSNDPEDPTKKIERFPKEDLDLLTTFVDRIEKRKGFIGAPSNPEVLNNWYRDIEEAVLVVVDSVSQKLEEAESRLKEAGSEEEKKAVEKEVSAAKDEVVILLDTYIETARHCGSQLLMAAINERDKCIAGIKDTFEDSVSSNFAELRKLAFVESAPQDNDLPFLSQHDREEFQVSFFNGFMEELGRQYGIPGYSVHEKYPDQFYPRFKNDYSIEVDNVRRNMLKKFFQICNPRAYIEWLQAELPKNGELSRQYFDFLKKNHFPQSRWRTQALQNRSFMDEVEKAAFKSFEINQAAGKAREAQVLAQAEMVAKSSGQKVENTIVYKRYMQTAPKFDWAAQKGAYIDAELFQHYLKLIYTSEGNKQEFFMEPLYETLKHLKYIN